MATVGSMVIAASLMPPFHARIVVVHSSRRHRRGAGKPMLQVEVLDVGRGHLIDQKRENPGAPRVLVTSQRSCRYGGWRRTSGPVHQPADACVVPIDSGGGHRKPDGGGG